MTSDTKIAANRANAKRSTGPRTERGRSRTRLNATRHGLTGQISVLTEEDRIACDRFCYNVVESLGPENAAEAQLAQSIADDSWRLNQIRAVENNLFALGHVDNKHRVKTENPQIHAALTKARSFADNIRQFELLTLYEQRVTRNMHRNLDALHELQDRRSSHTAAQQASHPGRKTAERALTAGAGFAPAALSPEELLSDRSIADANLASSTASISNWVRFFESSPTPVACARE